VSNGEIEIIRPDPESGPESGKTTKQVMTLRNLLEDNDPQYNIVLKGGEVVYLPSVAPPVAPLHK
jgi:hypothetical protein